MVSKGIQHVCLLLSTYGIVVTVIVDKVVSKMVDTVVLAVTESVAVKSVIVVVVVSSNNVLEASTLDRTMISTTI